LRGANDITSANPLAPRFVIEPFPNLKLYRKLIGWVEVSAEVTAFAGEPGNKK
jgi:hypothetical protein